MKYFFLVTIGLLLISAGPLAMFFLFELIPFHGSVFVGGVLFLLGAAFLFLTGTNYRLDALQKRLAALERKTRDRQTP